MRFFPYSKIKSVDGSDYQKFYYQMAKKRFEKDLYYVQEKVHGANFGIYHDGKDFKLAKRSGWIGSNDNFYNCWKVLENNKVKISKLFECLKVSNDDLAYIVVQGELCGGFYPGVSEQEKLVQKGVYYSPHNIFYAFDLFYVDKKGKEKYIRIPEQNKLFEDLDIFHAKTLKSGNLVECLNYSNEFNSNLPKWLGLKELESNICEGVVIKPELPRFLDCGSRIIIKSKNSKYKEIDKNAKVGKVGKLELSEEELELLEDVLSYVTENRLNNVMSKLLEDAKFGEIQQSFQKDVFEEFSVEESDKFLKIHSLESEKVKMIQKIVGSECANLVRKKLFEN